MLFVFLGLAAADWIPPPDPERSADEVAAMYADNESGIRAGAILIALGGCMQGAFVSVISVQLARIEGPRHPMAYAQLGFGFILVLLFVISSFCWATAAYRPERDPETTQLIHDFGWMPFISAVIPGILQNVATGITALSSRNDGRVLPRWLGYFNFYVAMLYVPAAWVMFFKDGPMAWDGVIAFWVLCIDVVVWIAVMIYVLLRAIGQEAESREAPSAQPVTAGQ